MPDLDFLQVLVFSYLLGSIPFGFLAGKLYGKDIRKSGSGNIGFTNVWRTVGTLPAVFVLILDAGKGWVSVYYGYSVGMEMYAFWGALGAIVGHFFPLFLGFKGGKGVATGFGICIFISPMITLIALVLFLLVVYMTRYISAGSITAALTVLVSSLVMEIPFYYQLFMIPAAIAVILMHHSNIRRILSGTENKIGKKEV